MPKGFILKNYQESDRSESIGAQYAMTALNCSCVPRHADVKFAKFESFSCVNRPSALG